MLVAATNLEFSSKLFSAIENVDNLPQEKNHNLDLATNYVVSPCTLMLMAISPIIFSVCCCYYYSVIVVVIAVLLDNLFRLLRTTLLILFIKTNHTP